ncbi:MAG: DUF87 domain-containing protein [Parasphingorhabdus sp.]
MADYPTLKERGLVLIANTVIAFAVYFAVSSSWFPNGGLESVWLIAALSFWFLTLLSAPWFVPPRDALISAVGALLILTTIEFTKTSELYQELLTIRAIFVGFSIFVIGLAIGALFLHDRNAAQPYGKLVFRLVGILGRGEILFTAPAILSILGAYQQSIVSIAWLTFFWIVITVVRPVEKIAEIIRRFREESLLLVGGDIVGTIARIDHPDIVRVRLSSTGSWPPNRLFTAAMPDGTQKYVISLFSQIQGSEVVGTGLCVAVSAEHLSIANGQILATHDAIKTDQFIANLSGAADARLVGFVVENSSIGILVFEIASLSELQEGDVVFVRIRGSEVFYQIVGAETVEENFDANPRGTHIVKAAQLGIYSPEEGFQKYSWLPPMNTPIFSAGTRKFGPPIIGDREFEIGNVPSTNIQVIANIDELVEYHTALLGVTGTGKTEVALDILREATARGVKVFCVDFTGDYRQRLSDLSPIFPAPDPRKASTIERLLATIDAYGFKAGDQKQSLKKLLNEIRGETQTAIENFLSDKDQHLAIFELADISNSKAGLRLTEIYLSAIMNWARENRRQKQVLICLEEAHTIVPEAFGSGFDGETKWVVERIGQIALQGRKYGVGLLVITQRTALVSKTILSQCNTFLTHSLMATSKNSPFPTRPKFDSRILN